MHTASYEILMKAKESAGCYQTLSSWVGSGDKTMSAQTVQCIPIRLQNYAAPH